MTYHISEEWQLLPSWLQQQSFRTGYNKWARYPSDSHRHQRQLYGINRREEGSTTTLLSRGFEDESFTACPSWSSSKCTFCLPHWTFILLYFCLSRRGDLFSFCFHITINKNSPRLKQHSNSKVFTSRKSTDSIQFWHNLLEYTQTWILTDCRLSSQSAPVP